MRRWKLLLLGALLALALAGCARERPLPDGTCRVRVVCGEALECADALDARKRDILPEDGVMLDVPVDFAEGQTAWDAFLTAAQSAKLHYESDGSGESAYLIGIGNLYTGDAGDQSGWVFEVNGAPPDVGCGRWPLADGDELTFRFVADFHAYFAGND